MKYLPFIITGIISAVLALAGDWAIRVYVVREEPAHHRDVIASNPIPLQPSSAPKSQVNLWQEFQKARDQALHDNPDLAAEYQDLRAEIEQQQKNVDAAMLKADPKVGPILAKLELLRHPPASPSANPNNPGPGTVIR